MSLAAARWLVLRGFPGDAPLIRLDEGAVPRCLRLQPCPRSGDHPARAAGRRESPPLASASLGAFLSLPPPPFKPSV